MAVNKQHWRRSFWKLPPWLCPRCQVGSLALDDDSQKITEPKWSSEAHSHEAWDPDWIVERFSCLLVCQNRDCGEVVAVGGRTHHEEDHDWEQQAMHWSRTFAPQVVAPAPPIFPVPKECPEDVTKELKRAFGLYWSDPASSANRLRVAVEVLLNDQKVNKTVINRRRKRETPNLHARIELFKAKDSEAADYLLAIKWLGNAGSHFGVADIDDDDLLGGFELIEHVIERLYVKREARLKQIAKGLNQRKGKPAQRRRRPFSDLF